MSDKTKSRLARNRVSQKTNKKTCFVCFFAFHGKQNKFVHLLFWENLWRSQTAVGFIWPLAEYQSSFRKNQIDSLLNLTLYYIVFVTTIGAAMVCRNILRPNLIYLATQSKRGQETLWLMTSLYLSVIFHFFIPM